VVLEINAFRLLGGLFELREVLVGLQMLFRYSGEGGSIAGYFRASLDYHDNLKKRREA